MKNLNADASKPQGRRNLVGTVGEMLRDQILKGEIAAGEKLPSSAELARHFEVSRTVIREAIAALKAAGLVEPRHGIGVFVLNWQSTPTISFQLSATDRISSIIEMLELRAAVEIEAAGLAATRRSPAQEQAILERHEDIRTLIADGMPTTEADYAFHLAVADGTNNPRFRVFLEMIGQNAIPRITLQKSGTETSPGAYLNQIYMEHARIMEAISRRDEDTAREAARTHLKGSLQRYRDMIRRS